MTSRLSASSLHDHLRAEERFASALQEASKADIRSTNGQCVGGAEIWPQPMSRADIDSLRNIAHADRGFEQDHVLTASVGLNISGYSNDQRRLIRDKIVQRVETLPGVTLLRLLTGSH
jgi:hypothetical protein